MTTKSTGENDENDAHDSEPKGGHPGPVDEGKNGGMATRELAPELTEDAE